MVLPVAVGVGIAARVALRYAAKKLAQKAAQQAAKKGAQQLAKKGATQAVKQAGKKAATKPAKAVKKCPKKGRTITLKPKKGWTERQMKDFDRKVKALRKGNLKVNKKIERGSSETSKFKKINGKTGKRNDIDHKQDLQVGGKDKVSNMWKLDKSVNRSVGAQIRHQIKDLKHGTPIGKIKVIKK